MSSLIEFTRRDAAERFLLSRVDYERSVAVPYGRRAFKLERMHRLLERLGNPHQDLPIVHVAGTKGKGSTTALIAGVLTAAGYRTGTFTSPHLDRIEERMAVDQRPCPAGAFADLVERLVPEVEAMDREAPDQSGPTFFEIVTALALLHFVRSGVDAAVLEVGMGGRLDSTNVCAPRVSVITSIGLDHTAQLGHTLEAIAREKAGIVKPGVPVVSGVAQSGPADVIRRIAAERGCRLIELGKDFEVRYEPPTRLDLAPQPGRLWIRDHAGGAIDGETSLPLGLVGAHQAANAAVAVAVLGELRRAGWKISESALRAGLAETVCPARIEVLGRRPTVVVDAAHNPSAIDALVRALDESFVARRRRLLFAATQEKDVRGMLTRLLDRFDEVIFTQYRTNPRSVPAETLGRLAFELAGRRYRVEPDPVAAWRRLHQEAAADELICVTGSFFLAAEMRREIGRREGEQEGSGVGVQGSGFGCKRLPELLSPNTPPPPPDTRPLNP